jgi:segregation and condensation protein B
MSLSGETAVETEAVHHADAFADGVAAGSPVCADLPLEQRVEVLLLATDRPLSEQRLIDLLGLVPAAPPAGPAKRRPRKKPPGETAEDGGDQAMEPAPVDDPATAKARRAAAGQLREAIELLNGAYEATGRTYRIGELAAGYQMLTQPAFGPLLARLRGERQQTRLSQAALETLAIIAYRQPILRADLESIRGVACGEVLKSLMDRRLVRIVGRAEEVGRPMLYGTTREFLRVFGLSSAGDLPQAKELAGG